MISWTNLPHRVVVKENGFIVLSSLKEWHNMHVSSKSETASPSVPEVGSSHARHILCLQIKYMVWGFQLLPFCIYMFPAALTSVAFYVPLPSTLTWSMYLLPLPPFICVVTLAILGARSVCEWLKKINNSTWRNKMKCGQNALLDIVSGACSILCLLLSQANPISFPQIPPYYFSICCSGEHPFAATLPPLMHVNVPCVCHHGYSSFWLREVSMRHFPALDG